jgi:hypothetical protein
MGGNVLNVNCLNHCALNVYFSVIFGGMFAFIQQHKNQQEIKIYTPYLTPIKKQQRAISTEDKLQVINQLEKR